MPVVCDMPGFLECFGEFTRDSSGAQHSGAALGRFFAVLASRFPEHLPQRAQLGTLPALLKFFETRIPARGLRSGAM